MKQECRCVLLLLLILRQPSAICCGQTMAHQRFCLKYSQKEEEGEKVMPTCPLAVMAAIILNTYNKLNEH
ncbi:hypothetical protein DOY81_011071 [Sarcophaga bullata]|nr:hypothetical protein DOY81_011071 [Sarcophaga bullata]